MQFVILSAFFVGVPLIFFCCCSYAECLRWNLVPNLSLDLIREMPRDGFMLISMPRPSQHSLILSSKFWVLMLNSLKKFLLNVRDSVGFLLFFMTTLLSFLIVWLPLLNVIKAKEKISSQPNRNLFVPFIFIFLFVNINTPATSTYSVHHIKKQNVSNSSG